MGKECKSAALRLTFLLYDDWILLFRPIEQHSEICWWRPMPSPKANCISTFAVVDTVSLSLLCLKTNKFIQRQTHSFFPRISFLFFLFVVDDVFFSFFFFNFRFVSNFPPPRFVYICERERERQRATVSNCFRCSFPMPSSKAVVVVVVV